MANSKRLQCFVSCKSDATRREAVRHGRPDTCFPEMDSLDRGKVVAPFKDGAQATKGSLALVQPVGQGSVLK